MSSFDLAPGFRCDVDTLVNTRLLVQSNSGGGKSWCIRRILEQTHGKVQQLVIDPEGEFSTLRERFDYILASKHGGDTAADPRSAKLLAERLLELGVSAILDIYELKHHERIAFVRAFLEALVDAPKKLWRPALIVLDEVHIYCPQSDRAESSGAVIDLATRGRKRGFCAVLATQRLSKLHKDAAAECNNKVIGRTGLDVDMSRAGDELGFAGKAERLALRTLKPGEFFAFGPAFQPGVTKIRVGDVKTSHPKAGGRIAFTPPPPTAKVKAMLPKLADLPAEAADRQKSLDEMKRELAATKRELTATRKAVPASKPAPAPKPIKVPVLKDAQVARLETLTGRLATLAAKIGAAGTEIAVAVRPARQPAPPTSARPAAAVTTAHRQERRPVVAPPRSGPGDTKLSGSQQRILAALVWFESVGVAPADKSQLALMSDQSPTSGGYFNALGVLRSAGLIDYPASGKVALTDAGRASAPDVDVPRTSAELHAMLFKKLSAPQVRILQQLIDAHPNPISKGMLADATGQSPTSGGYFNNLGRLRTLGLLDYPSPGQVVACPVLFLEGP